VAGTGERACPTQAEERLSPRLKRSLAVRRSGFESGAMGLLERHWHAVGVQVVREGVRSAGAADSSVPVRERAGADANEVQQPELQVSGRPAQHEADAGSQRRPSAMPASATPATAKNVPMVAARATREERSWRRDGNMIRPETE
jgi:hypothetical protein